MPSSNPPNMAISDVNRWLSHINPPPAAAPIKERLTQYKTRCLDIPRDCVGVA